ncbi:MAG TPA: hypothetical protein VFF04_04705 [Candidatus Babeliales bacterium]|nr:hypothetical protein [Candidatus Babeliales bacterium]
MIRKLRISAIMLMICTVQQTLPSVLLTGDPNAPANQTFSFPIKTYVSDPYGSTFYVGALNANQANEFSLSAIMPTQSGFSPLAPQLVTLDGQPGIPNPLYNQGIAFLDVITLPGDMYRDKQRPLVVTTSDLTSVYLIDNFFNLNAISMVSARNLKDINGNITSGIVGLTSTEGGRTGAFVGIKPAGGNLGDAGGGIALLSLTDVINGEKQKNLIFMQIGTFPVTRNLSQLAIQDPLTSMNNTVSMHWSNLLQRLFVGFQVQAGAGANDGARSVMVGQVTAQGTLAFVPFAPNSVFTTGNQDEIIGAVAPSSFVSVSQLETFRTTTHLDYLLVLGGNGTPNATNQTIYALPVVNNIDNMGNITDQSTQGVLASKNADPVDLFTNGITPILSRREIQTPATTAADIYTTAVTSENVPALVGGGPLTAGTIDHFLVANDTVFAIVSTPAANQLPGMFSSQALFDGTGKIMTWTNWQRVGGTTAQLFGASYSRLLGTISFMFGADANSINTVMRTEWADGDANELQQMGIALNNQFASGLGGIQSLNDFPLNSPGLHDISALIATGFNKVVLVETGQINAGTFTPTKGNDFLNVATFDNGALTRDVSANVVSIAGGVLDDIGPIITADVAVNTVTQQGYLFVGGSGGVAVLSNPNGTGWDATTQLGAQFNGLTTGMLFNIVGNYSSVLKVVYDEDFLYVLTNSQLDRLDLSAPGFPATTVATLNTVLTDPVGGSFLDVIISSKLALLATNHGLYRVGNGNDIQVATNGDEVGWIFVPLQESIGPVTKIITASVTGRDQDVARGNGGNVYVLNAYIGKDRAQIIRFSIAPVDLAAIDDATVQPLPDITFKNSPAPFINFGSYRNQYATDGALYLHSLDRDLSENPTVVAGNIKRLFTIVPLDFAGFSTIVRLVRNSASGSWLVAGDSPMRFNE